MVDFYLKYSENRRGLTGSEFMPGFLDEYYPGVSFDDVISDGLNHYGIFSGSGDELSKAFLAVSHRFSVQQISKDELIGFVAALYNPGPAVEGMPSPPTLSEYLASHGLTLEDELTSVKKMKRGLFKEIIKKKIETDNDSIADIAKSVALHLFHYDDLTAEEKSAVDANTATLKTIYTKAMCIDAYDNMITMLSDALASYYTAVSGLEAASTKEDALNVIYE